MRDWGVDYTQWTSFKLKTWTLYVETRFARYEICRLRELDDEGFDRYQLSRVRDAHKLDFVEVRKLTVPLPADRVEVLFTQLHWQDLHWHEGGVIIKDELELALRGIRWVRNYQALALADKTPEQALRDAWAEVKAMRKAAAESDSDSDSS